MTTTGSQRDLVVLVADRDMEAALQGLLARHQSLRISPLDYQVFRHPGHDSGCRTQGVSFLRTFCRQFTHALLLFDREGSGRDDDDPDVIEADLDAELTRNGWEGRAKTIVLDPELEIWIWSDSSEVDRICGWEGRNPGIREWLIDEGYLAAATAKPERPKEAFRLALRQVRKQPSSSVFKALADAVSFRRCTDRGFSKLLATLQSWFPISDATGA